MSRLELRLLGGFEARLGTRIISGFESQKARALLAYVALQRDQAVARERLSGLLWSERSEDSARRNLRQALHSVRTAFAGEEETPIFESRRHSVRLNPELDTWVDAVVFEDTVRGDLAGSGPDPHHLATAVRLYSGDLLAGFFVKECPLFEEWLVTEQERLRDEAIEAFRSLIGAYLSRGEHRYGIQYARRLLAIDPLSEETQRQLMLLYAQAGRRNQALAQYEHLRNVLNTELGVEPLEETTELYRSILLDELPQETDDDVDEPIGPLIPLAGRARELGRLQETWASVLEGNGHLTLVEGETGVGKSRLVKSYIDGATAKRRTIVLSARCFPSAPRVCYQPLAELLVGAFSDLIPDEPEIQRWITAPMIADLALMAPQLREIVPELLEQPVDMEQASSARLVDSLLELLGILNASEPGKMTPVILLVDDLQWADGSSRELFRRLAGRIGKMPVWFLATSRPDLKEVYPLPDDDGESPAEIERLPVARLDEAAVSDLARALVGLSSAPLLDAFLWRWSRGLPLAIAELINFLWDERVLIPERPGQWRLKGDPADLVSPPETLTQLIHLRVRRLPTSARRLLAVAAVVGQQFEADLLGKAADEYRPVVETCVELLLKRWLVRQFPRSWSRAKPQQDIVLWAQGARRGCFEFSHKAIRDSMLENINPLRKSTMHRDVARALRRLHADDLDAIAEQLCFHELACGEWAAVLPCLETAAEKARLSGADEIADWYLERATEVIERLLKSVGDDAAREQLREKRERILQPRGQRVGG